MPETPPSRATRIRGWVLIILGAGLLITLTMIRAELAPGMATPGVETNGSTFTGTSAQGAQILTLLNATIILSIAFVANGIYMALAGRINRLIQIVTLVLAAIAVAALYYTNKALS